MTEEERMQDDSPLGRVTALVADLRARCDWDRAQTRETLRPYLIEEVHELDAALASGDTDSIRDEVGDLLLHLAWQLVIARENEEFTAEQVAQHVIDKMHRRHPHLFDIGPAASWAHLKARERPVDRSVLDGLPSTLPDLLMAYRLQERAAGVGFDWIGTAGPIEKVREELDEVEGELHGGAPTEALYDEIGDLLFAVVNLARKAGVHPGPAMDRANAKFKRRFAAMEQLARSAGNGALPNALDDWDQLWNEVKRMERSDTVAS